MDFIKQCFELYSDALKQKLKTAGLTDDQVRKIMPELASVMTSMNYTGLEKMMAALLSEDPSQLTASLDVESIARKLEMNSLQVRKGIKAISPLMSQVFSQKIETHSDATDALSRGVTGEITSSVRNFLFNK